MMPYRRPISPSATTARYRSLTPDEVARELVGAFSEVSESDDTFVALLRASATSDAAAERMRAVFQEQVVPALAKASSTSRSGLLRSSALR
jgi:hypothetical protein